MSKTTKLELLNLVKVFQLILKSCFKIHQNSKDLIYLLANENYHFTNPNTFYELKDNEGSKPRLH